METCCFASCFPFKAIYGIELSETSREKALSFVNNYYKENTSIRNKFQFEYGSFQDCFNYECDIIYLDCLQLGPYLDEGVVLQSFFGCCENLLSGTYILILTRFDTVDITDRNVVLLFKSPLCQGSYDEFVLSVFQSEPHERMKEKFKNADSFARLVKNIQHFLPSESKADSDSSTSPFKSCK